MIMTSARAVSWVLLNHAAEAPVQVGDVVSVEAGGMPIYSVLGLEDGHALLRDERRPQPQSLPLSAFRWRGVQAG